MLQIPILKFSFGVPVKIYVRFGIPISHNILPDSSRDRSVLSTSQKIRLYFQGWSLWHQWHLVPIDTYSRLVVINIWRIKPWILSATMVLNRRVIEIWSILLGCSKLRRLSQFDTRYVSLQRFLGGFHFL